MILSLTFLIILIVSFLTDALEIGQSLNFCLPHSSLNSPVLTPLVPNLWTTPGSPLTPTSFAKALLYSSLTYEGHVFLKCKLSGLCPLLCLSCSPRVKPHLQAPRSGSYSLSVSSEYGFEQRALPQRTVVWNKNELKPTEGRSRGFQDPIFPLHFLSFCCLSASSKSQSRGSVDWVCHGRPDGITETVLLTSNWTNSFTVQMVNAAVKASSTCWLYRSVICSWGNWRNCYPNK